MPDPPDPDQVEFSLFGPGYGESVLVHLGEGDWMVVDSCLDASTSRPAATRYLSNIGVGLERVVAIVVSHWHDDHTGGLADLARSCPNARIYFSGAFGKADAQVLIEMNGGEPPKAGGGTREVWEVFRLLERRGQPLRTVGSGRILYRRNAGGERSGALVTSLSPSDRAIERSIQSMVSLIPQGGEQRTFLPWNGPNYNAIVLWVQIGEARMLLGADLEEVHEDIGWAAVIKEPYKDASPAEVFKIPHHGSMTGFHGPVWEQMLIGHPHAALTPFRHGRHRLPTAGAVDVLCELTDRTWITSPSNDNRPRMVRDSTVQKTLREAKIRLTQRAFTFGQVRLRRRGLSNPQGDWEVTLLGEAAPLCT